MTIPIFPKDDSLRGYWWHKLAEDISNITFILSILASIFLVIYYFTQVEEVRRLTAITEEVEISTIIRKTPGKDKMYLIDLGQAVKSKYPKDNYISDRDLALAVMHNYPRYRTYSDYSESYYTASTDIVKAIPYLLIGGFFLPSLIYRLLIPLLS